MSLELKLSDELNAELFKSIKEVYAQAMSECKRDFLITKTFLSVPEAMKFYNVSRNILTKWIEEKGLPIAVIDGKRYLKKSDIDDFIESHKI